MDLRNLSLIRERIAEKNPSLVRWWNQERETTARRLSVALVLVLAVGIRVWGLNQIGFNTDEAVYSGQAAAIAQVPVLKDIFPVFRAHPLLFQFMLALMFNFGASDLALRLFAVAIGVITVYIVYQLGTLLYSRNVGILAALILAVMPYHVVVSRQVLLDGPLVLCSTLTLYLLARYALTRNPIWLHAAGIGLGLTFLAKETGIILIGSVYSFFALSSEIPVRLRDLIISFFLMVLMILPFPLSLWLAGGSNVGRQYLIWQLFRRPNHTWDFYLTNVPTAIGILVVLIALAGLWFLRREGTWREKLLIWWIVVPVLFFQIWPTKGFQYLLPIAPPFALLASRTLLRWLWVNNPFSGEGRVSTSWIRVFAGGAMILSLLNSSWLAVQPPTTGTFIAGTGGVPGGREAGEWIKANLPSEATLLTIGPSMANILQYYGHRKALALSISPNPLHRNPAYEPVNNPDLAIRTNSAQYLVWDSYSAGRSSFFSQRLLELNARFHGRVIHTETVTVTLDDGTKVEKPVIVVYMVHP
ncbi:MAG TPA: glycosyltransferase family 39 protein [Anaerolineales bacterium]|nr:glycosyltransferase family 39 protein [Anaerolineales bacterium]